MKKIALIYSGYDNGLNSLEYNRKGVAQKLEDFGAWEIKINEPLLNEEQFTQNIDDYKDVEIDDLLIYYTGHGREFNDNFQLQISEKIGISLDTLYGHIRKNFENHACLPKRIAIVVDACYSGQAVKKTIMQFGTSEILTSSLEGMNSFETGFPHGVRSKMSLFSHYFCDAIETLQLELEEINLSNIQTHINKYVEKQIAPRGLVDELGYMPMTIAKGNFKEQNFTDVSVISVHFYPKNNNYEIVVNNTPLITVPIDKVEDIEVQQRIIDKVQSLLNPLEESRIELILAKELYAKDFSLWRKYITPKCETIIRSHKKLELSKQWLPQLKNRWKNSFDICKNMSFGHENVSVKVENEAMNDAKRISVIVQNVVEKRVDTPKVFEGIDDYYYIAIWINSCEVDSTYENFKTKVSTSRLCNLPESIRKEVVNNASNCASNINFMWDDPHTLVQKKEKHA